MTYKTLTTLFTFTGIITTCLARVEVLHERRWDLVGCLSPQRRQVHALSGVEFLQKIYLSDGQVDLQNHLSVIKSTCPTQENHKIKRLFNVAP